MKIVKVLLTKTIDSLGRGGEVVDVAEGYARNYLFPRKLATEPTPHNIAQYTKRRATQEAEVEERRAKAIALRDRLADRTLVFVRKAHDDNRLYGSVRPEEILSRVEEELGTAIESARVELERPVETLGPHAVTITLYKDIAVEVRVRVDKEGCEEA